MSTKEAELKMQAQFSEHEHPDPSSPGGIFDGTHIEDGLLRTDAVIGLVEKQAQEIKDLRQRLNWTLAAVVILTIWQAISWGFAH
jgi:hypothetical protein